MILYHVSPKLFSNLDYSKVGSAETGQRYAHGIYIGNPDKAGSYYDDYLDTNLAEKSYQIRDKVFDREHKYFNLIEDFKAGNITEQQVRDEAGDYVAEFIIDGEYDEIKSAVCYKVNLPYSVSESLIGWDEECDASHLDDLSSSLFDNYLMKDSSFMSSLNELLAKIEIDEIEDLPDLIDQVSDYIMDRGLEEWGFSYSIDKEDVDDYLARNIRGETYLNSNDEDFVNDIQEPAIDKIIQHLSSRLPTFDGEMTWGDAYTQISHFEVTDESLPKGKEFASYFMSKHDFADGFSVYDTDGELVEAVLINEEQISKIKIAKISYEEMSGIPPEEYLLTL